jgi:hypothetical protein
MRVGLFQGLEAHLHIREVADGEVGDDQDFPGFRQQWRGNQLVHAVSLPVIAGGG